MHDGVHVDVGMRALRFEAVSKRYQTKRVLEDVDIEVAPGDVVAITGGNGSGKSTLLRIMAGLSRPSSGSLSGVPEIVGYVPERFPPNERLSAESYLVHMGRIRGLTTRQAFAKSSELLTRLDLVGGSTTALRKLSKGNAQKVAVAQALLVSPQLLVLDEPWSGLDASAHSVLAEIIDEVAKAGGAAVFTDHRESITKATASKVYRIHSGHVTLGTVASLDEQVDVSEVLLRPPPDGRSPSEPDWYSVDGVLQVARHEHQVSIRVTGERCDLVLLTALQHGWSVGGLQHHIHSDLKTDLVASGVAQ